MFSAYRSYRILPCLRSFSRFTLVIRNLPSVITDKKFNEIILSNTTKVVGAYVGRKKNGDCKGVGFVIFHSQELMEKATPALQKLEIQGKKVYVHEYIEKQQGLHVEDLESNN